MHASPNGKHGWHSGVLIGLILFGPLFEIQLTFSSDQKMIRTVLIFIATLVLASTSFAHEGHGHPDHQSGVTHYIVNPSHAIPVLLTVAAAITIGILIRRTRRA
jgi:hypothetical protein